MSEPLIRYLREKANPENVYIWQEVLAKLDAFEEIFARSASEARVVGVIVDGDQLPNFEVMTKAQIVAWADAKLEVKLDPKKLNHGELIDRVKALLDERKQGAAVDHSSSDAVSGVR